jgi:signal transduction histidine kinase
MKGLQLRPRKHTLPLRLWLILAVAAITGAGFLAQIGLTAVLSTWNWEQQAEDARLASVRQIVGTDAEQWRDPAWQQRAGVSLAALGVDVALYPTQSSPSTPSGQVLYLTPGSRRFLDGGGQAPPAASAQQASTQTQSDTSVQVVFQRLVIANPLHSTSQPTIGVVFVWDTQSSLGQAFGLVWPAVELGTFALTLAIVVWLIGQPVLRPLAAMSQAAEGIAGGDLNVSLPPTPVREIAEVSGALEGMSGALRQSLDRQAALEEERRLFVGAIAHDLRTPLFILRGHLKGLERGVAATPEKIAHYVTVSQAEADALERLIADLFAYTRLEYLEQEPERAPVELGELLRQLVEAARPLAATRGITLALTLDARGEPSVLAADSHLLTRAVDNLLDNALRHTPAGGEVHVRLRREGATLEFRVEDTGPGIASADLPHLFTPLYRGEASRNRQTGGAGLGLAIARRIVRAHGGDLTAANRASGGAAFTCRLPASRGHVTLSMDMLATTVAGAHSASTYDNGTGTYAGPAK